MLACALLWVASTPVLAAPYFYVLTWLFAERQGHEAINHALGTAFYMIFFSIPVLAATGPVIGVASVFTPRLKPYLNGFWRGLLFAVVAGWLHCTVYFVLSEAGFLGDQYID